MSRQQRQLDRWMQEAVAHHQSGDLGAAERGYKKVLAKQKRHPDALHLLGLVHHMRGDQAAARSMIVEAIKLQQDNPEFHYNLANVEKIQGRLAAASQAFRRCIELAPQHYQALNNLANTLEQLGRPQEAVGLYRRALQINPRDPLANCNLGQALIASGQFDEAESYLEQAVSLAPKFATAHTALALLACERSNYSRAAEHNQAGLAQDPGLGKGQLVDGYLRLAQGQRDAAREVFEKVAKNIPESRDEANERLAMLDFFDGRLAAGFERYEGRQQPRFTDLPRLTERPNDSDYLLVVGEQGIGDEIRYARFLSRLNARGVKAQVLCEPRLANLFERSFPALEIASGRELGSQAKIKHFTHEVAVASLGRFYLDAQQDPAEPVGYLKPSPERVSDYRERLGQASGLLVGLAWRGVQPIASRADWYPPLEELLPRLAGRSLTLVNLQYALSDQERSLFQQHGLELIEIEGLDLKDDQEGLAALIANLGLVIGPTSAVSELACAVGVPTWFLVGLHWHMWAMSEAYLQAFYPRSRLFATPVGQRWEAPLQALARELGALLGEKPEPPAGAPAADASTPDGGEESRPTLSSKGQALIGLYDQMARQGYERVDEQRVEVAFSDFELRAYRSEVLGVLRQHAVNTVLDYGCGGSDWRQAGFDPGSKQSAQAYFGLTNVHRYEPARAVDERQPVDCVISFDVLEHVFISDVPNVLRDMFSYAGKLIVLNVACYPAAAKLPNGENAHITVRPPLWWKGMVDCVASEFPDTAIYLMCSTGWRQSEAFPLWSGRMWLDNSTFVVDY